ncbi:hypothetical protein [Limobrevibacterium gyesilva]|uniref:Uncharacterized protein n=1 Tax=Limobrevibacterium gyesilva TaxID=2991712 RepID=A0AA42CHD5_9PROT|nr:hypothetical protein [Limobrevibacterium gyesilva]MCW3474740.1 hypothetical protein [Limobrevibacterium gyesilva]
MTTTTTVAAFSEIIRVGGWSLRGIGYPFGIAERAIRILAWAEAVHGGTVRTLRVAETAIAEATTRPRLLRQRDSLAGWRLDGQGKHLMEAGPPAVDLLTSDAREHGFGHVVLANTIGSGLVAALADLAARRGLACFAAYRAAEGDVLPDGVARAGWLIAVPASGGAVFALGAIEAGADAVLQTIRSVWPMLSEAGERLIHADVAQSLDGGAGSYIGLAALPADAGMADRLKAGDAGGSLTLVDYAQRLVEGYRSGLVMDMADLLHLYALERLTWAPTSERSRSQAGYGRF